MNVSLKSGLTFAITYFTEREFKNLGLKGEFYLSQPFYIGLGDTIEN